MMKCIKSIIVMVSFALFLGGCANDVNVTTEEKTTEITTIQEITTENFITDEETTEITTTEEIMVKGSKENPYQINEVATVEVFVKSASATYESYSATATFELTDVEEDFSTWTLGITESSTDSSIEFLDFAWPVTISEKYGTIDSLIFKNEIDGGTYSWTTMYEGGEDTAYLSYYNESKQPKYVVIKYGAQDPNNIHSSVEKEIWFELTE